MTSVPALPLRSYKPCLSDNPSGRAVIIIDAIFLVLSALAIAVRIYGRRVQNAGLFLNDYAVLIAWPLSVGLVTTGILAVCPGGGGFHIIDVNPKEIVGTLKGYIAAEILWAGANVAVKISFLHLYLQIFGLNKNFRRVVYFMMLFVIAFGISIVLTPFAICRPFAKNWDPLLPGYCGNTVASITATSAINVCVDLTIISLPMPLIWKLQTSKDRKVSLTIIFSLGLAVCAVTLLRLVTSIHTEITDFTYNLAKLAIYTDLEPLLGMIIACLPLFPIAFKHFLHDREHGSSRNAVLNSIARWHTAHMNSSGRRRQADSILLTDSSTLAPGAGSRLQSTASHSGRVPNGPGIKVEQAWRVTTDGSS